ncbi:hypothetical protein [Acidaminococcus sp.]|uniref:hypothetical protein n=1 Tax=Acidaminococcus sp. TaxID=1872103 RepID=UPI003D7EF111
MEFDVIDYIKKEWKITLVIMILINVVATFVLFKAQKSDFQSKITIKLPQYIFTNPDTQTIIYLGENYVANEVGIKNYGVKFKGNTNPGTTIINFTVTGQDKERVLAFTQKVKPKLLEEINQLMQERFAYEWQLKNAQSGNITDYNSIYDKIHLASATDLTGDQGNIQYAQQGKSKKMLTIFLGSIIFSGCISMLHYLLTSKAKGHHSY